MIYVGLVARKNELENQQNIQQKKLGHLRINQDQFGVNDKYDNWTQHDN